MSFLHDTVKALRLATGAHTPNVAIERVWPYYIVLNEHAEGHYEVQNIRIVEHDFRTVPTATREQTETAQRILLASSIGNPVEIYQDFRLNAQRAAYTSGDYVECILKAATAGEVLIKHAAWMLTWEATTVLNVDPAPGVAVDPPSSEVKPKELIGRVSVPRLKGNWSSQTAQQPIGAWRTAIATRRNAVIHLGYRPNATDAAEAVEALGRLEKHLLDRLASQAAKYPRAALLLLGDVGLESRRAFEKVRLVYEGEDLQARLMDYLGWLQSHLRLSP